MTSAGASEDFSSIIAQSKPLDELQEPLVINGSLDGRGAHGGGRTGREQFEIRLLFFLPMIYARVTGKTDNCSQGICMKNRPLTRASGRQDGVWPPAEIRNWNRRQKVYKQSMLFGHTSRHGVENRGPERGQQHPPGEGGREGGHPRRGGLEKGETVFTPPLFSTMMTATSSQVIN